MIPAVPKTAFRWVRSMRSALGPIPASWAVVLGSAVQADPSAALDGWRGYKFGMTMAQARHVLGATLSRRPMKSTMGFGDTVFFLTKENGSDVRVDLRFLPVSGLRSISLSFNSGDNRTVWIVKSPADCEAKYRDILKASEARYGAFGTRVSNSEVGKVSIHSLQGGQSRYSEMFTEKGHPGLGLRMGDAVRYYGPRFVTVQMVNMQFGNDASTCQLSLALVDPT
jgi:hypothetical protein